MSTYRRVFLPGGTFFFTVTLADRRADTLVRHVDVLRRAYRTVQERLPFETIAICVLPDHLHALWRLPNGDGEYPRRWSLIKAGFSRSLPAAPSRSAPKVERREKGIWQRRYWEHTVRSDADLDRHIDYVHFNPVRHGLVPRVADWPHSSFHRYVSRGHLPPDWGGDMRDMPGTYGE
ncbi:REP-associated tyrosine transposase [Terrihabitans rhizophilus]|uniref:Transposase n=1 Tax=Terrihabitans rhizophilus TaxID=3092662 RepID=A0ABU4RIF2_9HYPH|nr:transposase [Terrihabitans sp. PJ23]MDX6804607.1 transposase [Terrihabitans sp. PJ23]